MYQQQPAGYAQQPLMAQPPPQYYPNQQVGSMAPQMAPQMGMAPGPAGPGMMGVGGGPGMLLVQYLPGDFCGCNQPSNKNHMKIYVNGQEVGVVQQGSQSTFPIPPGMHQISAKEGGIQGFFDGITGDDRAGSTVRQVGPGQQVAVTVGWRQGMGWGSSNNWYPFIE